MGSDPTVAGEEGKNTLSYFGNRIGEIIVNDIDSFLADKNLELRSESSITADFYKSTNGEYETHLIAMEKDSELISINLSVPTKEMAQTICDSWYTKNQQIYKYLMQELF